MRCKDVNHNLLRTVGHERSVSHMHKDVSLAPVSYKECCKKSVFTGRNKRELLKNYKNETQSWFDLYLKGLVALAAL